MSSCSVRSLKVPVQNCGGCWELDLLPKKNINESNDPQSEGTWPKQSLDIATFIHTYLGL